MLQYLVFVGAIINFSGTLFYLRDTLRGTSQPNRVTWLLWAGAPMIGAAAMLAEGVRWAVLPVFMTGFGPLIIFIASFINPHAYWKLKSFDYLCGALSVLALVLWGITREPIIAIVFALASDILATTPTLIKSWRHPETETGISYTTSLLNACTSFAAITVWSFSSLAFPIYMVAANSLLVFALYRRRILRRRI